MAEQRTVGSVGYWVLSPEEAFVLTRGEHGHPEIEGYGRTQL